MITVYNGTAPLSSSDELRKYYVFPGENNRPARLIGSAILDRFPWLVAGVWQNLYVRLSKSPVAFGVTSLTFDLMKNGATTGMQIVFTGSQTDGSYTAATVSANGTTDTFALRMTPNPERDPIGTSFEFTSYIEFNATDTKESGYAYVGYDGPDSASGSWYNGLFEFADDFHNETYGGINIVGPPGDVKGYRVLLPVANVGTLNYVIEYDGVIQNGGGGTVDTRLTLSPGDLDKTATFTLPVTTGKTIRIKATASGTSFAGRPGFCSKFKATTIDQFQLGGWGPNYAQAASNGTAYNKIVSRPPVNVWGATLSASTRNKFIGPKTIYTTGLIVWNQGAPGGSATRTVNIVQNGVDAVGGPSVVFSGNTNPQLQTAMSGNVDIATEDEISLKVVTASAPVGDANEAAWKFETATAVPPSPPATGTIRVDKFTSPVDTTSFDFTAGGGLSPGTFSLASGESQLFSGVAVGSGYSIVETANPLYSSVITVSNGSDPTNISVAADELVVVTVNNTKLANVFSGIYKIVPGAKKRNDTLWVNVNAGTTTDVKIPDPFIRTAYVGD